MLRLRNILTCLMGIFMCHNIIWIVKGNSSTFIYVEFFLVILYFLLAKKNFFIDISQVWRYIDSNFRRYIITTFICVLPGLIVFIDTDYYLSPLKGCVFFLVPIGILLGLVANRSREKYLLLGFQIGFWLSLFYSLLCYFLFQLNIPWRFIQYFKVENAGFDEYNTLYYRAQGFFTECSFYMCFLASTLPLMLYFIRNIWIKLALILTIVFLASASFTGNLIFIFFSISLYFIFIDHSVFQLKTLLVLVVPIIIFFVIFNDSILDFLSNANFFNSFVQSLNDLNIHDEDNISNQVRLQGIQNSINLVTRYPLGTSFGCSAPLLEITYADVSFDQSTYSFLIKVILESGWLGGIFYIVSLFSTLYTLIHSRILFNHVIAICLFCATLCQIVNGIGWFSFVLFIWALAFIHSAHVQRIK